MVRNFLSAHSKAEHRPQCSRLLRQSWQTSTFHPQVTKPLILLKVPQSVCLNSKAVFTPAWQSCLSADILPCFQLPNQIMICCRLCILELEEHSFYSISLYLSVCICCLAMAHTGCASERSIVSGVKVEIIGPFTQLQHCYPNLKMVRLPVQSCFPSSHVSKLTWSNNYHF